MITPGAFFVCSICCFPICNTSSGPVVRDIACPVNELLWRLLSILSLPHSFLSLLLPATNNDRCARQWQPEIMTNDSLAWPAHANRNSTLTPLVVEPSAPSVCPLCRLSRFAWESVVFMFSLNLLTNCISRG